MSLNIPTDGAEILRKCCKKLQNAVVLVVGDIMLDKFIYGGVERISPESPVPVLSVAREDTMLGGAGNALANLAGLGAKGAILSLIGNDKEGAEVKSHAKDLGFDITGLITDASRPTIVKTRFLAGHQQLLRADFETKSTLSDEMAASLIKQAEALMENIGAVILSDYGKGVLRDDVIAKIIELARAKGLPVIVDPKGNDFSIYKGASAITPNRKELSEATNNHTTDTDEEVIEAAASIIEDCGIDAVVATRSQDGMSIIQKTTEPVHLRSADIEVFDVSGAGDTVIATIAATLAAGGDLVEAAQLANLAGSIVVTKVGTAPIRIAELEEILASNSVDHLLSNRSGQPNIDRTRTAPICAWDEAAEQIRRWKARGLKVGFTNGCFDILHAGHVMYLNETKDRCDRLVIGLNCDASISILKGPDRPVHDELSRAAVLGGLGSIDMVVMFGAKKDGEDNTACALIEALQPDIYFKGGDYTIDQIPETPSVQSYGGEVCVMSELKGHSTTNSIKKMQSGEAA